MGALGKILSLSLLNTVVDLLLRYKQKVADSELACEQAHQYLIVKAKTRWADLSKVRKGKGARAVQRRRDGARCPPCWFLPLFKYSPPL